MTDYTKTTDFTSKDSLPSGDSGKIIRGAEFGTEFDNIETAVNSKSNINNPAFTGNITVTGTVDGRDIAADGTKLDTIETSADVTDTANVTAAGAVMDSELTDITAVKALNQGVATTDSPTFAAVTSTGNVTVGGTVDGRDVAADGTKLDTVETNADVTDTTNVTAAGALMDSEVTNLAQVKAFDSADYATAAQGTTADNALPKTGGAMTGAITTNSTFDGRDVATDGTKLDGIEASADVTDTANVTAAGALMDSELTSEASVKALNQGVATTDSPTFAGVTANGTVEFDGLSGTGAVTVTDILDQDDMSGNSATALATQQSIKAYVDSQVGTVDTLAEVLANGNATGGTDIAFGDNDKAVFGAGSDLQIYHSGTDSRIVDGGTGSLFIGGDSFVDIGNSTLSLTRAKFSDSTSALYQQGNIKLATSSTGIDVSGTATMDGLTVDGNTALNNTSAGTTVATLSGQYSGSGDVKLLAFQRNGGAVAGAITYADASTGIEIGTTTSHTLALTTGDTQRLRIGNNGDISFYEDTGATPKLFWDASAESLGIGTSSPAADLQINDGNTTRGVAGTFHMYGSAVNGDAGDVSNEIFFRDESVSGWGGAFIRTVRSEDDQNGKDALTFGTSPSGGSVVERMRIDSTGNVGIGTSSPDTLLHLSHATGSAVLRLERNDTSIAATDQYGAIEFEGQDANAGANGVRASMRAVAEASVGQTSLTFSTAGQGVAEAERMRIDSSGKVGIGTDSPALFSKLHVSSTTTALDTGGTIFASVTDAVAADKGGQVMMGGYYTGTTTAAFGGLAAKKENATAGNFGGYLQFLTSTNGLGNTEKMRIDSSGNLLVGKTSAAVGTDGAQLLTGGYSGVSATSTTAFFANRNNTEGDVVEIGKNGVKVGSIGTQNGQMTIGSADTGLGFQGDSTGTVDDAILPVNISTGARRDDAISLGHTNGRFKDLYLSGGVVFGATGGNVSSKTLDDYEEGTWTPTLSGATTNPTPTAVTVTNANYTKIGNTVFIRAYISVNLTNVGSGGAEIEGLPFAVKAGTYAPALFTHGSLIQSSGGYFASGTNRIIAINTNDTSGINFAGTGTTRYLMISGQYETA